jgi:hypothetical protein
MKRIDRSLGTVALLAILSLPVLCGCDVGGAARPGMRNSSSDRPLDRGLSAGPRGQGREDRGATGGDGALSDSERRYREVILREVVENPKIGRLIARKPVLGGTWRVGSREDVEFLGGGKVALEYEDGHAAGKLVVKIKDPHDLSTWEAVRDDPE